MDLLMALSSKGSEFGFKGAAWEFMKCFQRDYPDCLLFVAKKRFPGITQRALLIVIECTLSFLKILKD